MRQVTFVELSIYEQVLPLVAGYLQAYACKDSFIANTYQFEQYAVNVKTPAAKIIGDLLKSDSDVYAFSCYVWNIRLARQVLAVLMAHKPHAHFILGGPQVMDHGHKYLDPQAENLLLCNGEGEKSFAQFLSVLTETQPDFSQVDGVSFYRDRTLITTPEHARMRDLNEIPSPYLNGLFAGDYRAAIFETNRGCPFSCGFCFWGAATNDKVFRFDEERIRAELHWISQKQVPLLFIADANWGIFPRDIDFSQQIAQNAKRYQSPSVVYFSAAKNKPDKVSQITEIFDQAEIMATQPVSLQSLNPTALTQIDRENIKLDAYMKMQASLKEKAISTYTELIWPLPGETLSSFMDGINTLCAADAGAIITYSHILLHNTTLYHQREKFGLVTVPVDEGQGEVELIVQTNEVSRQEHQAGLRYYYAVHLLHNLHLLTLVSTYLHRRGIARYSDLFMAFADFLESQPDSPLTQFCQSMTEEGQFYAYGEVAHVAMHAHRDHTQSRLHHFVSSQPWWRDEAVRVLFEFDLLRQPYFYRNTPFTIPLSLFQYVNILDDSDRCAIVEAPKHYLPLLQEFIVTKTKQPFTSNLFYIDHNRTQFSFVEANGLQQYASYCFGRLIRSHSILPEWTSLDIADLVHA